MKKYAFALAAAASSVALIAGPASAYTLNGDGTGFVGKGEVQGVLSLNNAQVQSTAVSFTTSATDTNAWSCTREWVTPQGKEQETVQQRNNVTTVTGVVSSTARLKNQITGYNLLGYTSSSPSTDGPATGSCPASPSGFVYDNNNVNTPGTTTLFVNGVALQ